MAEVPKKLHDLAMKAIEELRFSVACAELSGTEDSPIQKVFGLLLEIEGGLRDPIDPPEAEQLGVNKACAAIAKEMIAWHKKNPNYWEARFALSIALGRVARPNSRCNTCDGGGSIAVIGASACFPCPECSHGT